MVDSGYIIAYNKKIKTYKKIVEKLIGQVNLAKTGLSKEEMDFLEKEFKLKK